MGIKLSGRDGIIEKKARVPWYYYILCAFAFSATVVAIQSIFGIVVEDWLRLILSVYFIFFLPRQIWEAKSSASGK